MRPPEKGGGWHEAAAGVEGVGYTPNLKPRYRLPERSLPSRRRTTTGPVETHRGRGRLETRYQLNIGDKAIFSSSLHGAVTWPWYRFLDILLEI